ncbi:hypothetical protein LJB88_05065, partial [Erysipelotrichaceae bacterium OttesenSCG-928-M19]|nr:hypothetical protein [Erysipelotrichaceae bacterium OttesenSCG-928-M19]
MFKSKKILAILLALAFIMGQPSANAKIDYAKNEDYYQKLCSKKSTYNANKKACSGYEEYLKERQAKSDKSVKSIKEKLADTKGDINKIIELIKENDSLITQKSNSIKKTKKEIVSTKKEIVVLEAEVLERLSLMQEIDSDNFVIDFVMSSTNLNDFITKLDGISAINQANNEVVEDLNDQKAKLIKEEDKLKKEEKTLKESKKIQ